MMSLNPYNCMENTQDVSQGSSPVASEGVIPQTQLPGAPVVTPTSAETPPGAKTPPENLYAALAEERRLRKEAEDKLNNLTTTESSEEVYSDEGKLLKQQIDKQSEIIAKLQEDREIERLQNLYPALRETREDFKTFLQDYPRHKIENVAKIFLSEKGLLETERKGLEKPTGGQRTPMTSGMSAEEVEHLRKTDYRKYKKMLMDDQIKFS